MSLYYWSGMFISWATLKLPTIDHKSYYLGKLAFKQALAEKISQEVLFSEFLSQDN